MQSYIYYIIFLCYGNFAVAKVNSIIAGKHVFENVLMDIKPGELDAKLSVAFLQEHKSYQIKHLTREETTIIQNKNIEDINGYLEYLIDKRQTDLLGTIEYYETYLQRKTEDPLSISDDYSLSLKQYFNKTFKKEDAINDIDKQFVMFDLMETANKVLFNTKKKVISNMTDNKNITNTENAVLQSKYYKLLDDLHEEIINNKKEEMKNICEMFDICRVFPTYSDYIADLLFEILFFSNIRLDNIVTQAMVLIKEKINFFRDVLGDELTSAVGDQMHSVFNVDATELRRVLSLFKQILHQRHKFSSPKNHNRSIKAKAIRILIDIVDKSFEKDDGDILLMYISITKNGLRDWTNMKEHDISGILASFFRYITNNLSYNWTADTKKEVRTLVEVLMKSKVTSEDVYEYLFSKGSQCADDQRENNLYLDLI